MNHLTVIASATSRLHADIMLIRLRRAEINCRKISVLYPTHSMPNAVGCWLPVASQAPLKVGDETIGCAGHLRKSALATDNNRGGMTDLLTHSGINTREAVSLVEKLEQGHILVAVNASNDEEAAIAWQVFQHCSADTLAASPQLTDKSNRRPAEIKIAAWVGVAA